MFVNLISSIRKLFVWEKTYKTFDFTGKSGHIKFGTVTLNFFERVARIVFGCFANTHMRAVCDEMQSVCFRTDVDRNVINITQKEIFEFLGSMNEKGYKNGTSLVNQEFDQGHRIKYEGKVIQSLEKTPLLCLTIKIYQQGTEAFRNRELDKLVFEGMISLCVKKKSQTYIRCIAFRDNIENEKWKSVSRLSLNAMLENSSSIDEYRLSALDGDRESSFSMKKVNLKNETAKLPIALPISFDFFNSFLNCK